MPHQVSSAELCAKIPNGIQKEVLVPAEEICFQSPTQGDECQVHYVGRFLDMADEPFDSSRARGAPKTFKLGAGEVIKAWDIAVATMRKGEISRFICEAQYAYGEQGAPPRIPGNATLVFEIELLGWASEDDLFRDGSVLRKILSRGAGYNSPPQEGTEVCISFKMLASGGEVLEDRGPFDYILGSSQLGRFSSAVDRVLGELKKDGAISLTFIGDDATPADRIIELRLHHIYEVMDVSPQKNGIVSKRSLLEGVDYKTPRDAGHAHIKMELRSQVGDASISSFVEPIQAHFTIGNGEICDAVECAILEMHKGDRVEIIAESHMFIDKRLELHQRQTGRLALLVELCNFTNCAAPWEMSPEEKVEFARARKDVGSRLFKEKRYLLALQRYSKAAEFLIAHSLVVGGSEELRLICELNKAACFLKLDDGCGAKRACSAALEIDSCNLKALYRRGSAQLLLQDFSDAVVDLKRVLELDPVNKEAQRLLYQALRGAQQAEKKSSLMFLKMNKAFSGFAEAEEKRVKDAKELQEADLARKSAAAKAEARKWKQDRGHSWSKEESKENLMRAHEHLMDLQKKIHEMELSNRGLCEGD